MSFLYKVKAYYIDLIQGKRKGALAALFSLLLGLLSLIYGFLLKLILACYQKGLFIPYRPECRVISVGNITWGGTGKTPLVEAVAKFLKQQGGNPAILIRGYGKDEVYMLKDRFKESPILAGRDRIKTAKIAKERYAADTLILDDGFQHWRLGRDLDIVLIDATCPFGNSRLIPRGALREPLSSLSRADIFVLTKTNEVAENIEAIKKELQKYNYQAPIYEAIYAPTFLCNLTNDKKIELSTIKNQSVALVCGIASPESFARTLNLLGCKVSLRFYFPDHYQYSREDLARIEKASLENQVRYIITTEKDAVKLAPLLKCARLKLEVLALGIELKIVKDEQKFFNSLKNNNDFKKTYSILILSDGKAGHLHQSQAVARIIQKRKMNQGLHNNEINTKIVAVKFKNRFCRLFLNLCSIFASPNCRRCFLCLRLCLNKNTFKELIQSSANIIVSAGSSLSALNLFLSYKNRARKVILMKPLFLSLARFDLAIIPEHDRVKVKDNVLQTRIAPNLIDRQYLEDQANILKNRLQITDYRLQTGGPKIGVLIGGDTPKYRTTVELMNKILCQLKVAADNLNCQILLTTSRRTSCAVAELLKKEMADFSACKLLVIANENNIPEAVGGILGLSDIVIVSGESISMVSEAISAEKYVLVFIPEKRIKAKTKQEEFLEKLEKQRMLTVIHPDNLFFEIEQLWQERPRIKKINDRNLIYQAISKII